MNQGSGWSVNVSELAKELGVTSRWVLGACAVLGIDGVVADRSTLSEVPCQEVRDFHRHNRQRKDGNPGDQRSVNRPTLAWPRPVGGQNQQPAAGPNARSEPGGRARDIPAKARTLIDGGHPDCAIITLYAQIDNAMKAILTPEQLEANRPIETVFAAPEQASLRNDLHWMRLLANRAKHQGAVPTRYEAEKALWLYQWLFGPQGEFGQQGKMSA